MSDVTYSVTLPGGLNFTDTSTSYKLVDAAPAEIRWRRLTETTPFVAGDQELAAVQDVSAYRLVVRCIGGGTNAATLANNLKASATAGNLVVVLASASETYVARAADVQTSATFEDLLNNQCVVTLVFPTQPFPT